MSVPGQDNEPPFGTGGYFERMSRYPPLTLALTFLAIVAALEETDIPFIDDAPPVPRRDPNLPFTRAFEWMKLIFNGISVASEFVLLIIGWTSSNYGVSRTHSDV